MSEPLPGSPLLARFPANVQADYASYRTQADLAAADRVIVAIVVDHVPAKSALKGAPPDDAHRLIADLEFDSLTLAEVIFFVEDLFQVRLNQSDLNHIITVGDLRAYVKQRLPAASAR